MKCNKCGEKWTNPPGKTFKFCPNCAAQVPAQAEDPSDNIIKTLVLQHGEDILQSPSGLLSYAADNLKGKNDRFLKNLKWAMMEDVPQKLLALKNADEFTRNLRINVILAGLDEAGMKKEPAIEIVSCLAEALGIEVQNAPPLTANQNIAKAAAAPHVAQANKGKELSGSGASSIDTGRIHSDSVAKIGGIMPFAGRDWRILDIQDGKALLISERIVEKRRYHSANSDVTWAECELQFYLNSSFFDSLGQEKLDIADTKVITNNNPWYGTNGGHAVINKIFLLSIEEVIRYFGNSGKLTKHRDSYYIKDQYDSARLAFDENRTASLWWLRSPGFDTRSASYVNDRGYVLATRGHFLNNLFCGVRPVLWLNL